MRSSGPITEPDGSRGPVEMRHVVGAERLMTRAEPRAGPLRRYEEEPGGLEAADGDDELARVDSEFPTRRRRDGHGPHPSVSRIDVEPESIRVEIHTEMAVVPELGSVPLAEVGRRTESPDPGVVDFRSGDIHIQIGGGRGEREPTQVFEGPHLRVAVGSHVVGVQVDRSMGHPLCATCSRGSKSIESSGEQRPPQAPVVPPSRFCRTVSSGGCRLMSSGR